MLLQFFSIFLKFICWFSWFPVAKGGAARYTFTLLVRRFSKLCNSENHVHHKLNYGIYNCIVYSMLQKNRRKNQTNNQAGRQTVNHTYSQADKKTDKKTDSQRDRHTDRQQNIRTVRSTRYMARQTLFFPITFYPCGWGKTDTNKNN